MKAFAFPVVVLTAALTAIPIEADEKRKSRAWLDSRGTLTVTDLENTLDVKFSGAERNKIEAALAHRNASIASLNDQLYSALGDSLKMSEAQISARAEKVSTDPWYKEWPPERLEAIRRAQPQRYEGLMIRKKKREAREREAAQKAN